MPTVRIHIPGSQALDGETPINFDTVNTSVNEQEQLTEYFLTNLDSFGYFDPGSVFGNQSADMMLTHFLLSAATGVQKGQVVFWVPPNWLTVGGGASGSPFAVRPVWGAPLGSFTASTGGVISEGSCLPIPVDHALSFRSLTDDGPWLIQMTFQPVPRTDQDWDVPLSPDDIVFTRPPED
jgi:hypothetical protein